ncbi:GNAT family N-acetyltransferase [Streptomyces sp. SAI-041]|uniref:GNAT family N-acetyltransferase n=1 Tax=Streptomyces sp. SAI-041 TaxID=2940548 RepID=UPI00247325C7|nr:GNAT family N-acetyltransferase [Streptomyces sp. SAI-041]MDH6553350.1 RimJ/RimL family protein N-acetyltransferase [Streptomyces sp. SAI-041]
MDTNRTVILVPPVRLEGYGVALREWADTDLADLVALYDDPEMARWTPVASPFGLDAARAYLAGAREGQAEGHRVQLAVTTDGTVPRGEVLLFRSGPDEQDVELAYGVGAAHRGQRLAGRAVRLAAEYAVREIRPRRVVLRIDAANAASEAVARSCGFELTDEPPVSRVSRGREAVLRTWRLRA